MRYETILFSYIGRNLCFVCAERPTHCVIDTYSVHKIASNLHQRSLIQCPTCRNESLRCNCNCRPPPHIILGKRLSES